jgi:hypothetical protein
MRNLLAMRATIDVTCCIHIEVLPPHRAEGSPDNLSADVSTIGFPTGIYIGRIVPKVPAGNYGRGEEDRCVAIIATQDRFDVQSS